MAVTAADARSSLELPPRLELPLFDYGLLKPDQLAYPALLDGAAQRTRAARLLSGGLRHRDGLPLLDPDGDCGVDGVLIEFSPGSERNAYDAICGFAPRQHYRWVTMQVAVEGGERATANTLLGRHPGRGSAEECVSSWSAVDDPVLRFGPHSVRTLSLETATPPFPALPGDNPGLWDRFFRLQAAYLLLWSAVDRFTALALGPGGPPLTRAYRLGDDPRFREAVVAAGVAPSRKTPDSRDPQKTRRIREDGSGAMYSWEAVRSNLSHPGKTAFHDGIQLRRALVELHDTFQLMLLTRLPELATTWEQLDPAGRPTRWLMRPVVSPDGLT
jgi:hypothetical protein